MQPQHNSLTASFVLHNVDSLLAVYTYIRSEVGFWLAIAQLCYLSILPPLAYRNICEEGEHCDTKAPPVLLVSSVIVAKEIVSHYSKEVHEDEQE